MFKSEIVADTSDDELFIMLSNQIREDLSKGRPIQERPLLELATRVFEYITDGDGKQLPEEFYALTERVDDYWHYENNTDNECEFSYARLYQMISTVKIWEHERAWKKKLNEDICRSQYMKYFELLQIVNEHSGIVHEALVELLSSASGLAEDARLLEKEGFLHIRNIGRKKYYHMSRDGERLFKRLEQITKNNEQIKQQLPVEKPKEGSVEIKTESHNELSSKNIKYKINNDPQQRYYIAHQSRVFQLTDNMVLNSWNVLPSPDSSIKLELTIPKTNAFVQPQQKNTFEWFQNKSHQNPKNLAIEMLRM
jgi:predicted transcriptional regulator